MKKKLLYITLAETIMQDILSGKLAAGSKVLSVREMALAQKVNPKTVQKAFEYLEGHEIFESHHGEGRFVTSDKNRLEKIKDILIDDHINDFVNVISTIDLPNNQIIELVATKLKETRSDYE